MLFNLFYTFGFSHIKYFLKTQFQPSFISTKGNNLGILVTFTSLNIRNDEKIITKSKPIDINSELSAVSRKTYKNLPKPESVKLTHDVASEIERLRNIDFEPVTKPTVEPELNYKDGIHIKKPLSEPDLDLKRIDDYLIIYKNPLVYIPTILVFSVSLPSFSYFLVYGREVSRYSIRGITSFVLYFLIYNTLKSVYIIGIVLAIIFSFLSFSIALKPLKYFNFGPRSVRKEPIGWIFVILFSCVVFSNLVYKILFVILQLITGSFTAPRFLRAIFPVFYLLFLTVVSGVVLGLLIVVVPTKYAQNSVFALSCSYILMSGVSYLNDFLVYNFTSNLRPLQFDMTQFFDSNVTLSTSHFLIVLGTLLVSSVTTFLNSNKYLK
ncbi:putative integral membrane protein [Theileria parva strain Muguga]|uniref:putative integral membrane protein n=1 Tax=Theileria parva strain Muguga TaxID=333668 RepID=UPI001C623FEF|nr:putative integral membrane protein [Theileria parva strain Muguga]EAN32024.2 putative integral membrane protein [Theileria parva strain Muguga]